MNVSLASLQDALREIFERRGRTPEGLLFTWAEASDGKFLAGLAMFTDEASVPRATLDYRQVRLHEIWVPLDEGLKRLMTLLAPAAAGAGGAGKFQANLWGERQPLDHHENLSRWPEWVLTARVDDSGSTLQCPPGPAVSHGMRPFASYDHAVEWWLFGEGPKYNGGGGARHLRELLIVVPDRRGSLTNARWDGNRISGTIHTRISHEELELQVVVDTDEGPQVLKPLKPAPSVFIWDVPENARRADVYLVHSSGDLMGRSSVTPGSEVSAETHSLSVARRAERDLANGENDRVEFKPFIGGKDDKDAEVLASVVAFANTYGGSIYLGIRNDGLPEGDVALNKVLKGEPEEKYRKRVDSLVRERLKPVPSFTVEFVDIGKDRVVVISVEKGLGGPYSTKEGNHVFIRKGASNMRPDPITEMPQLFGGGGVRSAVGLLGDGGWPLE